MPTVYRWENFECWGYTLYIQVQTQPELNTGMHFDVPSESALSGTES
jgi:hypothetical protein